MFKPILFLLIITILVGCNTTNSGEGHPDIPGTIAFSAQDESGTFQIFTMNADGSNVKKLTSHEGFSLRPAWSPDGERIAFARFREAPIGSTTLWVINADGSNERPLIFHPNATGQPMFGSNPNWHPDGSQLAFDQCINCERSGRNNEIFITDLQTGIIDTLLQHPASDGRPQWSPDGTKLLFLSDRALLRNDSLSTGSDIFFISIDNKTVEKITVSPGDMGPHGWISPDSIFYTPLDRNTGLRQLLIYNLKSGNENPVLMNLEVNQFWIFWDQTSRKFLSIEKKNDDVSINIRFFNLNGNIIEKTVIKDSVLRTAKGFKWKTTQ